METGKKLEIITTAAEDKIGDNIQVIDLPEQAGIADKFVLVTGRNNNHTKSIADEIEDRLAKEGEPPMNIEGLREGSWILMDCGEIIVHIFTADQRDYYRLDQLWA